jgi:hypothetical protein
MMLPIKEFGDQLLAAGDLDPVYTALWDMHWEDPGQVKRWLLAYWSYYHCGVACYLSELKGLEYWEMYMQAAENIESTPIGGRWPRGKERRHFRGDVSVQTARSLTVAYPDPEGFVDYCSKGRTLKLVSELVQDHPQFGPWIGFKVADMLERVLAIPVEFKTDAAVRMFKDPYKSALMVWDSWYGTSGPSWNERVSQIAKELTSYYVDRGILAPPIKDRLINIQEVETVLCKWKSHCHGHYPVGNDIHEVTTGVAPWAKVSPTARQFITRIPALR